MKPLKLLYINLVYTTSESYFSRTLIGQLGDDYFACTICIYSLCKKKLTRYASFDMSRKSQLVTRHVDSKLIAVLSHMGDFG